MLCSKTKFFRSVLTFILAISLIGGLAVFKGFSLCENEENSGNSAVVVNDAQETIDVGEKETSEQSATEDNKDVESLNVKEDEPSNEGNFAADVVEPQVSDECDEDENIEDSCEDEKKDIEEVHTCLPGECAENPIIINSLEDLEDFAEAIEAGNNFSGKFFELRSDITIPKDNKFFSERLQGNGILFDGEFNGHINSSKNKFICICVDEIPEKVFLAKKLGEEATIFINLVINSEEEVSVYTFSCC